MDEVDRALFESGPVPLILKKYLLATGERGLGYQAVWGSEPLSAREFELLFWIAQRVALASTDEGKKEYQTDKAIRAAIAIENGEMQDPYASAGPVDFEAMTHEQYEEWMRRNPAP
ncbi:MAG: hypothetical protein ACXWQ5_00205 [Ktedonobacterales bacterium]